MPVVVQKVAPRDAFERALVENLQRADLNPIEEAEAYRAWSTSTGYTQEQVAERVGKDRSTVANAMRLLKLPRPVRGMVEDGQLSMGHARALLGARAAGRHRRPRRARSRRRGCRCAPPRRCRGTASGRPAPAKAGGTRQERLGARPREPADPGARRPVAVTEDGSGKGGAIEIRYADLDDLDRLLERLLRR